MPEAALCQQVSFVVPVLNEAAGIGAMLRDLRARYAGSEIIVVDGGSVDQTVARAMPLCDQLLTTEAGRARQMNLGGRVASNSYVFFLHADSSPGVAAEHLAACLARQPQWGFCRVRLSGSLAVFRVIERFMNWRSRLSRVATGDQMLFLRKSLFQQTQGFELIPLMEAVAYCKRLRRLAPPWPGGENR